MILTNSPSAKFPLKVSLPDTSQKMYAYFPVTITMRKQSSNLQLTPGTLGGYVASKGLVIGPFKYVEQSGILKILIGRF